jgi:predicted Zn-dependent protease
MRLLSSRSFRAGCLAFCLAGDFADAQVEPDGAAAGDFLGRVSSAAPEELDGVLADWGTKATPEALEGVLAERLRREPESRALWRHLDEVYESAGWSGKRIAHLQAWIARRPEDQDDESYAGLAGLLVEADRAAEAVAALEGALSRGRYGSWRLTEQLAALHVLAGHPGKVDELARRFQKAASETDRPLAHLLLARADLARYRPDDALAHYRDLFAAAPVSDAGATEEYLALLDETGKVAEAVKFLERRWEVLSRSRIQPAGSRAEFIARQLSEAGLVEAALACLEKDYQTTGSRPAELLLLQGQLHLESGDAVSAIRVLREAREKNPDSGEADELLSEAYRVFARQPG